MDIRAAILEIAKGGAIKTRMMYGAYLSFPQLKEYLDLLTDGGLLEYSGEEKICRNRYLYPNKNQFGRRFKLQSIIRCQFTFNFSIENFTLQLSCRKAATCTRRPFNRQEPPLAMQRWCPICLCKSTAPNPVRCPSS